MGRRRITATQARGNFTIELQAIPPEVANPTPPAILRSQFLAHPRARESSRERFGRALNLNSIDQAIRSAQSGQMKEITDLSRETIDTDPHLGGLLQKRFGAIATLPIDIVPAQGEGIDRDRAEFYARVVRDQISHIPRIGLMIQQLAWGIWDGRAVQEINWTPLTGPSDPRFGTVRWQVRGLGWIHPRRIFFGPRRELRVIETETGSEGFFGNTGILLDEFRNKFIQFTPQLFGEYQEREGLALRCLYWSFFKRFAERERMILLELFGKPWRIAEVDEQSTADADDLTAADEAIDALGHSTTVRMPRGVKLNVISPGDTAGKVHESVIEESDKQLSKLILGQTGTTDGVTAGFNSNTIAVLKDEQLMIMALDAKSISETVEDHLTDSIIELNFGPEALPHAPKFMLRSDLPLDSRSELERLQAGLNAGLSIGRNEAYEVSGFKIPDPDEIVLKIDQPPTPSLAPVAPEPRPVFVFPTQDPPPPGLQQAPSTAEGASVQPGAPAAPGGTEPGEPPLEISEAVAPAFAPVAASKVELQIGEEAGEGGVHIHTLDRAQGVTAFDGIHGHLFQLPDGTIVTTAIDGAHFHSFEGRGADEIPESGEHTHIVEAAGLITGSAASPHTHEMQVSETAFDGTHIHTLELPDGTVIESMTAGQFAEMFPTNGTDIAGLKHKKKKKRTYSKVACVIRQVGAKWVLFDSEGEKQLGEFDTREEAEEREREIKRILGEDDDDEAEPDLTASKKTFNELLAITGNYELAQDLTAASATTKKLEAPRHDEHVCCTTQPNTVNGSPDQISASGVTQGQRNINAWVDILAKEIGTDETPTGIFMAIQRAQAEFDLAPFAGVVDRKTVHSNMLGILDLEYEFDNEAIITVDKFAKTDSSFASMAFDAAVRFFLGQNVVSREAFDALEARARVNSFTISRITSERLIALVQSDLGRQISTGASLRGFVAQMRQRIADAGFTTGGGINPLAPGQVDTIFRTNVVQSYNAGRFAKMTDPDVLSARPVWEIRTANDGPPRQRRTHRAVQGTRLLASDPFWREAYPPFGFNCRCRVIARRADVGGVTEGSSISGLPDRGFNSGTPSLSRVNV